MADREQQILTFEVDENAVERRIDVVLATMLSEFSRSQIQKIIKKNRVSVGGKTVKSSYIVELDDLITVEIPAKEPIQLKPVAFDLDIVYEDDELIVINKPAGLVVHPGAGSHAVTLVQALLHYFQRDRGLPGDQLRPGIVHRLDKDTTGLMVCAKTPLAHDHLAKQFHDKTNERSYVAIVDGFLTVSEETVESYLFRDPRHRLRFASRSVSEINAEYPDRVPDRFRWSKSEFSVTESFEDRLSFMTVKLYTGRTHQIRVHASALGVPVLGDPLYHREVQLPNIFPKKIQEVVSGLTRQMLHAQTLGFVHPKTGDSMIFTAPLPADFADLLELLRAHARSL